MSDGGLLRPPGSGGEPSSSDAGAGTPPPLAPPAAQPPEAAPPPPTSAASVAPQPSAGSATAERPWLRVITADPDPRTIDDAAASPGNPAGSQTGSRRPTPTDIAPPHRRLRPEPLGVEVVGGSEVALHRLVALDRFASGYGALEVTWSLSGPGFDLIAVSDDATVDARGGKIVIDLLPGLRRVLIATGTPGTAQVPASRLSLHNGSTTIHCDLPAGTSHGVWPRLSLTLVDEFLVVIDEQDGISGMLDAVCSAYSYDPRTFVLAQGR